MGKRTFMTGQPTHPNVTPLAIMPYQLGSIRGILAIDLPKALLNILISHKERWPRLTIQVRNRIESTGSMNYNPNHIGNGWVGPYIKGILAAPPKATPPRNKGLIRPY